MTKKRKAEFSEDEIFIDAVDTAFLEKVDELISVKRVRATDKYGNTALHFAAVNTNNYLVTKLIEAGANVNAANNSGFTPLMEVIREAVCEEIEFFEIEGVIRILIENGANSNGVEELRNKFTSIEKLAYLDEIIRYINQLNAEDVPCTVHYTTPEETSSSENEETDQTENSSSEEEATSPSSLQNTNTKASDNTDTLDHSSHGSNLNSNASSIFENAEPALINLIAPNRFSYDIESIRTEKQDYEEIIKEIERQLEETIATTSISIKQENNTDNDTLIVDLHYGTFYPLLPSKPEEMVKPSFTIIDDPLIVVDIEAISGDHNILDFNFAGTVPTVY